MIDTLIESLQKESDRGCVLIGAELLSDNLQSRLEQVMQGGKKLKNELLTGLGPISTFSAKIKISYCFKVISQNTYRELNYLRAIRNVAAHSIGGFSFEHEEVKNHLALMKFFESALIRIENGEFEEELVNTEMREALLIVKQKNLFSGRAKYNYTVALLYGMLAKSEEGANN